MCQCVCEWKSSQTSVIFMRAYFIATFYFYFHSINGSGRTTSPHSNPTNKTYSIIQQLNYFNESPTKKKQKDKSRAKSIHSESFQKILWCLRQCFSTHRHTQQINTLRAPNIYHRDSHDRSKNHIDYIISFETPLPRVKIIPSIHGDGKLGWGTLFQVLMLHVQVKELFPTRV